MSGAQSHPNSSSEQKPSLTHRFSSSDRAGPMAPKKRTSSAVKVMDARKTLPPTSTVRSKPDSKPHLQHGRGVGRATTIVKTTDSSGGKGSACTTNQHAAVLKSSSCSELSGQQKKSTAPNHQQARPGESHGAPGNQTHSQKQEQNSSKPSSKQKPNPASSRKARSMSFSSETLPPSLLKKEEVEGDGGSGCYDSTSLKSATICRLENKVAELRKENGALKQELATVRSLYDQLVYEAPSERFEQNRVHLLKSQVIQLERQVLLLSQALSQRAELMLELQNMLDSLLDKLSSLREAGSSASGGDVAEIAARIRVMKGRLGRCHQSSSLESLAQPLVFMDCFVGPRRQKHSEAPPTLLDVCSGSTEHLNLKHVSRLESRLMELYGTLTELQAALQTVPPKPPSLLQPMEDHLTSHVTRSCKMIGGCCHDLLCMSLLVPAAPWPPLKGTEVSTELRADTILGKLPPSLRNKREARDVIGAAARAFSYHSHMQAVKCKAMEQELGFHRSVYQLQLSYVESLFEALRNGYQTFESSAQDLICKPIEEILASYQELRKTASDDSLKRFLKAFQENWEQLKNAEESLTRPQDSHTTPQGSEALSEFGRHFFGTLRELEEECAREREKLLEAMNSSSAAT